jgi:hypothetical protein
VQACLWPLIYTYNHSQFTLFLTLNFINLSTAYEKFTRCLSFGTNCNYTHHFLSVNPFPTRTPHIRLNTTLHIPEPATPTVAAPAPINFAAESISLVTEVVWKLRTAGSCERISS